MIELKVKDNKVSPLTYWAANELLNDDIIDPNDVINWRRLIPNYDSIELMLGEWYWIRRKDKLNQEKYTNKMLDMSTLLVR